MVRTLTAGVGFLVVLGLLALLALMLSPANPAHPDLELPDLSLPAKAEPVMFTPNGGNATINSLTVTWKATDSGCNYSGSIGSKTLSPLDSWNPCDPADLLAWFATLKEEVGADWENLLRTLDELFGPFIK